MRERTVLVVVMSLILGATMLRAPSVLAQSGAVGAAGASPEVATDAERLYCDEHYAHEDECFICHPELREKGRLWCNEHERYEDRCFLCHPELREEDRLYCDAHGLYEDECFLCHPELKDKPSAIDEDGGGRSSTGAQQRANRLMCNEHGVFEDECGICHPELAATLTPGRGLKVRFASADAAAKAGIETVKPEVGSIASGIEAYAEIVFDQNKLAHVAVPVGGIIRDVDVDLGDRVDANDRLAAVSSASIAEAVSRLILARQTLERERRLYGKRISAEREVQEAQAIHQAAYQHLRTLGFTEERIADLHEASVDPALLELRAPFAGEVIERNAVQGSRVGEGDTLFVVADRSVMWAMLSIPEAQLPGVRLGQLVEVSVEPAAHHPFTGELTWLAARVDGRTRMARARVELSNPDGLLRANMFARARILTQRSENAVLVPSAALQQIEGRPFVFVELEDDLFEARPVRVEAKADGQAAVVGDLGPDSKVVVSGSYLVKSQLQLSRLGAGCVD